MASSGLGTYYSKLAQSNRGISPKFCVECNTPISQARIVCEKCAQLNG
jgi:hypothetical protein